MSAPAQAKANPEKVLDFLRVSSNYQDVNKQRRDCATNRKTFNLETKRALEIQGLSGTDTLTDEEVKKILRELEDPSIRGLNIASLDRLFRPAKDPGQWAILRVFKDSKKVIFSAREGIIDLQTTEGMQKAYAAGMQSAIEWLILRERTMKGHIDSLSGLYDEHGNVLQRPAPMNPTPAFGYIYLKKHDPLMRCPGCAEREIGCGGQRYIIDEERAEWVRKAFVWARAGVRPYTIATRFVEAGVRSQGYNGHPGEIAWSPGVIRQLLHKRKFFGEYVSAKGITITDPYVMPAIIDRQLWEDVQEVLKRSCETHQGQPPKADAQFKHLLRKLLYHGAAGCGRRYHTNPGIRAGREPRPYYICGNIEFKPYHHRCDSMHLFADLIEPIAWSIVWDDVLKDPALLLKLGAAYYDKIGRPGAEHVEALEYEREHLKTQREEIVQMITHRIIERKTGYERIYEIDARIKSIEAEMRAAGRVVSLPTINQAAAALADITRDEPSDYDGKRAILERILDLRFTYNDGWIEAEGKVPIPAESTASGEKYSKSGLSAPSSTNYEIPFQIKRRVA